MNKKLIILFIVGFVSQSCSAEICPTVLDLKQHLPAGWNFYDSDEGTLLPAARMEKFKLHARQFVLAEWGYENNKNGTIHCYYTDKEGSNMEAYVAKDNYKPASSRYWYKVTGYMHCAAGKDKCQFKPHTQEPQLAKN